MATTLNKILAIVAVTVIWGVGFWIGRRYAKPEIIDSPVIVYDTVERYNVQYETKYITKTVVRELPVYDTIYKDSVRTVFVEIPISTYHFEEDSLYAIDVEGYDVSLKKVQVYPKTIYRTQVVKDKYPRFGFGIQAGYGIIGNKASPYIGIGVSYNIIRW